MTRDWLLYIDDILDASSRIETYIKGMSADDFREDRKTQDAVVRNFEVIGEAAKNVPRQIREQYPRIPWREMSGMRDKLTHAYFGVNIDIVWKTARKRLPQLNQSIRDLLNELDPA